jgi:uncharacterized protein (TIGR02594 family)
MSDAGAPWLATMRELAGVKEYVGGDDNPTILGWARFIGNRYSEMASYAALYKHDATPWCGLTVAYAMAKNGIRPVFGSTDVERFLWARAWAKWGTPGDPRPGSVMVFSRDGGGHVAFLVRTEGDYYVVLGGNQSNAVNETRIHKSQFVGAVWPTEVAASQTVRTPNDVRVRMGQAVIKWEARRDSQGRLMVHPLAADDGGGAYEVAGINERYHPVEAAKLRAMVEGNRHAEAEQFVGEFVASYTDVADVWTASWGIEFYLRDCVFNRGPTGAARILQRALGVDEDGEVGPITRDALERAEQDVPGFLQRLRAARESYERNPVGRNESSRYWAGLVNRWNAQVTIAQRFHAEQPQESIVTDPVLPPQGTPEVTNPSGPTLSINNEALAQAIGQLVLPLLINLLTQGKGLQFPTLALPPPPPPPPPPPAPASGTSMPDFITGLLGLFGAAAGQATGVVDVTSGGGLIAAAVPALLGLSGLGGVSILPRLFGGILSMFGVQLTPKAK